MKVAIVDNDELLRFQIYLLSSNRRYDNLKYMDRYALIDASNIIGTTYELLNFAIDWSRLANHLKGGKWSCKALYYYQGCPPGKQYEKKVKKFREIGYIPKIKETFVHPDRIKDYIFKCDKCGTDVMAKLTIPGQRKSNCDVDLAIDGIELAGKGREFLIFTGDGDFAPLVEKLIEKGSTVKIISNTKRDRCGSKTFSSRLSAIITREESGLKRVGFIDINDWKVKIAREIKKPPSSVAASELSLHVKPKLF